MIPEHCPSCDADLVGDPIPEDKRELYGNAKNFSRVIGIYDLEVDRTIRYQCPDCKHEWVR